jgi:hypothetical protein
MGTRRESLLSGADDIPAACCKRANARSGQMGMPLEKDCTGIHGEREREQRDVAASEGRGWRAKPWLRSLGGALGGCIRGECRKVPSFVPAAFAGQARRVMNNLSGAAALRGLGCVSGVNYERLDCKRQSFHRMRTATGRTAGGL